MSQHKGRPVVRTLAGEGAQNVSDDAVDALDLTGRVMTVWQAED